MQGKSPGRPPTPLNPDASHAARLGAEIRKRRLAEGLTLKTLGQRAGYSIQHLSSLELATGTAKRECLAAIDATLNAGGALLELLTAAVCEQALARHERATARSAARQRYDDDVDPTNRRGLLEGAAGAALSVAALGPAPAAAREVDPELPSHWSHLLRLLGRHDELFGPRDVLDTVIRELRLIAEHRAEARGELRVALMRVESRWAEMAAWLSEDSGDHRARDTWIQRALRLAKEVDYADMAAFTRARQSEWTGNVRRSVSLAEEALRARGTSVQTRAWCSRQAALGHAMAGDAYACERRLHDAYVFLEDDNSPVPPWAHGFRVTRVGTLATEASCWLAMEPVKAIPIYENALNDWPRSEVRDGGLYQARLALACAAVGERDRAEAEGRKAFAIARATKSVTATRELKQLGLTLSAN